MQYVRVPCSLTQYRWIFFVSIFGGSLPPIYISQVDSFHAQAIHYASLNAAALVFVFVFLLFQLPFILTMFAVYVFHQRFGDFLQHVRYSNSMHHVFRFSFRIRHLSLFLVMGFFSLSPLLFNIFGSFIHPFIVFLFWHPTIFVFGCQIKMNGSFY